MRIWWERYPGLSATSFRLSGVVAMKATLRLTQRPKRRQAAALQGVVRPTILEALTS